ncbi:sensor histidine kinase [Actinomadura craniellae]|uniref:Sensor-like histidine kinase SenX3 n=1 Tax=Actinomadura craniellae TaxID=2231787 RepID=A0A365HAQ2_9ACTN|nr:HAMP domain-containing sensor histidine kinase [Actinomadura craniellae]RAY16175.1 sensor histidine kinase [Actinomadura craniellae]
MPDPLDRDRRLLTRTRRLITVQVAGAISAVLALAGALVYGVTVSGQEAAARHELAHAARRASVAHPPPCTWLFELRGGAVQGSPGAPAALPVRTVLDRVAADRAPRTIRVEAAGHAYLVRTQPRGDAVVQVAMDLHHQAAERRRLLRALAVAEVAGLLAALLVGQVLARRAIAPLGEALARRRRFAADVSHELRAPLARLHTRAQLVARRLHRGAAPAFVAAEMDRLVTGTRQLGEVVEDLLLAAQSGRPHGPFGPVDLAALAEEAVAAEAARARERGVTVEVRRDPGDHVVRGAETALRRVISALLDNALTHTAAGGRIRLTLSASPPRTTQLTVRDDGTGFDPRDAERLFTRSVSGHRGSGLGLALAREVVDAHGGTITADGRPGVGATFTVRLPVLENR